MINNVSYYMVYELSELSHIYESTISDCFYSVCHKYDVSEEQQKDIKKDCIEKARSALKIIYS